MNGGTGPSYAAGSSSSCVDGQWDEGSLEGMEVITEGRRGWPDRLQAGRLAAMDQRPSSFPTPSHSCESRGSLSTKGLRIPFLLGQKLGDLGVPGGESAQVLVGQQVTSAWLWVGPGVGEWLVSLSWAGLGLLPLVQIRWELLKDSHGRGLC